LRIPTTDQFSQGGIIMRNEALDVVIADDNPALLCVLSEIFRESGHHVRSAFHGFVALAEIKKKVPDILLSDLGMPGMSGYELLSVVRRRFPSIRVIAMSGAHSGGGVPAGIAADAFYAKGVSSVTQLLEMVNAVRRDEVDSRRSAAPVWISQTSTDTVGDSVLLISCPECLRPFFQRTDSLERLPRTGSCPHCMTSVELAFARPSHGTDRTPLSIAPDTMQIDRLMMTQSNVTPANSMLQEPSPSW
jgi:CheY-like chemotaxis protein